MLWSFSENLTCGENMEEYGRDWCICSYHVYLEIWEVATGEVLANYGLNSWTILRPMFSTECSFFHFLICYSNCLG